MLRIVLRLFAALLVFVLVAALLNTLQFAMLNGMKSADVNGCRALQSGAEVLHIAVPFGGLLAGLVVAAYPLLRRRRWLRPLGFMVLAVIVAGAAAFGWSLRPMDPFAGETLELAGQLAALPLNKTDAGPHDLSLRGLAGQVTKGRTAIDVRMVVDPGCGQPFTGRIRFTVLMEQTVQAVLDGGQRRLRLRWLDVSRHITMNGHDLSGEMGSDEGLRNMTVEATQDASGALRDFKVHSPDANVQNQQTAVYETAVQNEAQINPGRPATIGDSWPAGQRDMVLPGAGLLSYDFEARFAGLSNWQGRPVAVIDLVASQPKLKIDEEQREPPKLERFLAHGRAVLSLADGRVQAQAATLRMDSSDRVEGKPVANHVYATATLEDVP